MCIPGYDDDDDDYDDDFYDESDDDDDVSVDDMIVAPMKPGAGS